jgi:hypothetical protein
VDELNDRLNQRNVCNPPPMYFSPRPVPTKYTLMPIVDERKPAHVPIQCHSTGTFFPGNGPWAGLSIDVDSLLRYSASFFPSTSSDLYNQPQLPQQQVKQPHPYLFATVSSTAKPTPSDEFVFNNCTKC